jgi:hypothetical protein
MEVNLLTFGAFLVGFLLSAIMASGGPVALAMARRRGFMVGWEIRTRYPEDAHPRTMREIGRLLREDDARLTSDEDRDYGDG